MVTRSVRTNKRKNERGGCTARKHSVFADTVGEGVKAINTKDTVKGSAGGGSNGNDL